MAIGDILKKKIPGTADGNKIREMTGANTFGDFIKMTIGKTPIGGTIAKSTPTVVDVKVPKKKFASIGIKQMRTGRSGTIITSGGLLSNNKITIKKKTLLGS
jgi:hypothetical protein